MDSRIGVSLVGDPALSMRLHEILPREHFRIRFYSGQQSRLQRSRFIDEFIPIGEARTPRITEVVDAANSGVLTADDWMIYSADQMLYGLRDTMSPGEGSASLVPVSHPLGWSMLGSKTGLAEVCQKLKLLTPETVVARNQSELGHILATRSSAVVVKGDQGGGGSLVRRIHPGESPSIPEGWFPVVVQEFIDGPLVSIEAVFRRGALVAWAYSTPVALVTEFGWSTVRDFTRPPDDQPLVTLDTLARTLGLHGFANCSFVVDGEGRHLLIEADLRPNRWHQFMPKLGVNLADRMTSGFEGPLIDAGNTMTPRIYLYPRDIERAIKTRSLRALTPWLTGAHGTWDWRHRKDHAVNRMEARSLIRTALPNSLFSPKSLRRRD